jgi:transposase
MDIIKQVVGIDVSKDTLAVCYGTVDANQNQQISKSLTLANNLKGFRELMSFVRKNRGQLKAPLYFVMEATGVYYENLAYS